MKRIWTSLALLGLAGAAHAQSGPSFDCTAADGAVEELICTTPELSALDRELAALYPLTEGSLTGEAAQTLRAYQRGWIKGRNDCWKAGDDMARCAAEAYATRIYELRSDYPAARADTGGSFGPFSYDCDGMNEPISVVFVPGYAVLRTGDEMLTLPQTRAASGGRYEDSAGNMIWSKGDGAMVMLDGTDTSCTASAEG